MKLKIFTTDGNIGTLEDMVNEWLAKNAVSPTSCIIHVKETVRDDTVYHIVERTVYIFYIQFIPIGL